MPKHLQKGGPDFSNNWYVSTNQRLWFKRDPSHTCEREITSSLVCFPLHQSVLNNE